MTYNSKDYETVFKAIEDDYVFSDEKDEDDFFVLVDENREINENFKPKKALGSLEMEKEASSIYDFISIAQRAYLNSEK